MNKRFILILILFVSSISNLFAQFEVMTTEQAKKALTENLSLTSAEVDQIISKYNIPFSNEILQNGCNFRYSGYTYFRFDDIVGIKFYLTSAEGIGALCVNNADSTLSIMKLHPGYYTITQKLLFTEQIQRLKEELLGEYTFSSSIIEINDHYIREFDTTHVQTVLDEIVGGSITKKQYQSILLNDAHSYPNTILVLSDDAGNDFYMPNITINNRDYPELKYLTSIESVSGYACSYLEKMEKVLKNQECYLKNHIFEKVYQDPISGDTKENPDENSLYKCERLIMMDGKLYGIFSNNSGNYSVRIGLVRPFYIDYYGNSELESYDGAYHTYSDNGIFRQVGYRIEKCNDKVVFVCDGCINGSLLITPKSFLETKYQLEKEVKTSLEAAAAKSRKEYEQRIEQERKANIEKYGSEFGGNINNRKVALGMTKEMCQKSWGYPSERYSKVNSNGTVEIWVYYSAMLSFRDGKLVQIEKW